MHIPTRGLSLLTSAFLLLSAPTLAAGDTITQENGLVIEETHTVKCDRPTKVGDTISVHYRGTLENGVEFDESWARGMPFTFKLGRHQVIAGWDAGLINMCVGSQRNLTIPPAMGYGARNMGNIPPNSVLLFKTQLMHIEGIPDPSIAHANGTAMEQNKSGEKPAEFKGNTSDHKKEKTGDTVSGKQANDNKSPMTTMSNGECRLLGPFALVVQSALGVLALMSLVFKRYRERPRRPIKIWFFDVSKQVVGTALLHIANLAMSMLSVGIDTAARAHKAAQASKGEDEKIPNPCSFYLLNLAIDTTIGIPILVVLLRLLHAIFLRTPLANPPESLKSGHYGSPPHVTWWIKQSFIYFIGLFGMKLFVLFMFQALPWLPWVGDWALRWTEGNQKVQIAFVMFLFPLAMNAIQYYIIDTFIKEKTEEGYETVQQDEDRPDSAEQEHGRRDPRISGDEDDDDEDKLTPVVGTSPQHGESSSTDSSSTPLMGAGKADRVTR